MRIGVNALYLIPGGVGGTETYLRELLRWMPRVAPRHEYFAFVNRECESSGFTGETGIEIIQTGVPARSRPVRLIYEQVLLPTLVKELNLDVLFNPGFTCPAVVPCPNVTTFHDLQHKRHPEYFRWFDLPAWNFFLGLAARRSQRIVAVSEATRDDFRKFYPKEGRSIDVTPLAAREEFFSLRETNRQDNDLLLCVSTTHPHKNHLRLVNAFARWRRESGAATRLVLAGMRGFAAADVEGAIASAGAQDFIQTTGWIAEKEVLGLFRDARAFIFPSLFEGFGIPVIEALACGLPTAVSDVEPMRSNAGDAALLFDPLSEDAIAHAIAELLGNAALRERLRHAGPERARTFSWERTAQLTVESLESAAGSE